jgi:CubicO group peptidase (beta-lactamase class C family)
MNRSLGAIALWLLASAAVRADELPRAKPEEVGLSAEKLGRVTALVQGAVDRSQTAGVVVLIARHGKVAYLEAFGKRSASAGQPMPENAIFRIHSMTKPITSAAALRLYDEGKF